MVAYFQWYLKRMTALFYRADKIMGMTKYITHNHYKAILEQLKSKDQTMMVFGQLNTNEFVLQVDSMLIDSVDNIYPKGVPNPLYIGHSCFWDYLRKLIAKDVKDNLLKRLKLPKDDLIISYSKVD